VRVVHVPFTYWPDPVGGTEVYVAELARGLRERGVESFVAAPAGASGPGQYDQDGTPVHRFPLAPVRDVADLYGEGDERAAQAIASILDEVDADVLHLHAFTRGASLNAARAAKRHGVAVVFTYHTPTASCVRGTLLHNGTEPCDGTLDVQRCTSCFLESRGVGGMIREALSRAPAALGETAASIGAGGSVVTALRARTLTEARHDAFRRMLREADAVVAVCAWVHSLLSRAGAPASRLTLSRQGAPASRRIASYGASRSDDLRLAFVGRLHPTKGIHIPLRGLVSRQDLPVRLDIYGVAQDSEGERYASQLRAIVGSDARVRLLAPLSSDRIVETLAGYDATIVPSQWLETGPLTVLESFAAGVPVIGSNLGGISELVTHESDGWLVSYADSDAWSNALRRLATDRSLVERLRRGVRPPRTTDDVARDMTALYEAIVPRRAAGQHTTVGIA
jgi:glycosyltransferase involved in cell wall biosynthesis